MTTDRRSLSTRATVLRALRSLRAAGSRTLVEDLLVNPAFLAHVDAVAPGDRLCFVSHHSYLARGLTLRQRIACAHHHYSVEEREFDDLFLTELHQGSGIDLWSIVADGVEYDIRLTPGQDVVYEGGWSAVLYVDGERVCVVSCSRVDAAQIGHGEGSTLFITRKQLTSDHEYQNAFNKAFDRTTPAHLCVTALSGVAQAFGDRRMVAIAPEAHPAFDSAHRERFERAYGEFWTSLAGVRRSPVGFDLEVPLLLTPLDELSAKARKRAVARRRHLDGVRLAAAARIRSHLLDAPCPLLDEAVHGDDALV